jgi:hypothetical protein
MEIAIPNLKIKLQAGSIEFDKREVSAYQLWSVYVQLGEYIKTLSGAYVNKDGDLIGFRKEWNRW